MSNFTTRIKNTLRTFSQSTFSFIRDRSAKNSVIVNHVDVRPIYRKSQDIQSWRNALASAEGVYQQRYNLYELYEHILIDGYLSDAINKRIRKITNAPLVCLKDGKVVEEVKELMKTTAWENFLTEAMNAKFWGHSLIVPTWGAPGKQKQSTTTIVNRRHVKPRFGIVTKNEYDTEGLDYTQPPYANDVIEVGKQEDLGLILKCCPLVIYKRGNFGDWVEFAEVFGMPLRWATYRNEQSRSILEEALSKAGSAGYVVAPEDAKIDFLSSQGSQGNDIFKTLREAMNEEISITILGNTMTTTVGQSSGYAQSKTHADGQEEIHADDRAFVLRIIQELVTPYLARLGYPVDGVEWSFNDKEKISLKEQLEIALKVSEKVPVGASFWYETFGIPVPEKSDVIDNTKNQQKDIKKKSLA